MTKIEYPIEEIAYKMQFIMGKLQNGEELTLEEENYAKKMTNFKEVYDALCLEHKLKEKSIDEDAIINYLMEKRKSLIKIIKGSRSKNKLMQLREQVANIEKFIKSGSVHYFKDFLIDHNEIDNIDIANVYDSLARKDKYLCDASLNSHRSGYDSKPFIYENRYTNEVHLNRPLIDFIRIILAGNFKIFNAIEQRDRLLRKNDGEKTEEIRELENLIPANMRSLDVNTVSKIIYYAKGRVGYNDDNTFAELRDDLDILAAIDDVLSGKMKYEVDSEEIDNSIASILDGIIVGTYKPRDFLNYQILEYFDSNVDSLKFREILRDNRFDLDVIQRKMLQDDLLSKTKLNGNENLFVDNDGELNLGNLSLAAAVMNGEEIDEEDALSADPNCLERIRYFRPTYREDPHDYERDKYDVKILLAIAKYRQKLKEKLKQTEEMKESKAANF